MATQRVSLAKIAGPTAHLVVEQFRLWHGLKCGDEFPDAVQRAFDECAVALRDHSSSPPVVYFSEWIDLWSMGDIVPGLGNSHAEIICGQRFWACCHGMPVSVQTEVIGGEITQESWWLKRRLEE